MPDDLDDKIRAAMKVLDGETPTGYFEAVPNQILARLEDGSMQHGSGTTDFRKNADALMGPPVVPEDADTNPTPKVEASDVGPLPTKPVAKPAVVAAVAAAPAPAPTETAAASASMSAAADRDEDSGLHDIRNLAQSTKQRLSARRITQSPPTNDDVLASSSGSFAGIALPQPAKMVSLPEIEDLPSKQEVIAAQKAAAKARKEKKPTVEPTLASKDILAPQASANLAVASMTVVPAAAAEAAVEAPVRQAFSLPSQQNKKSKAPLFAVLGLGAAAAAGAFIFMGNKGDKKAETVAAASNTATQEVAKEPEKAAVAAPTAEPIAAGSAAVEPAPAPVEDVKPEAAAVVAAAETDDDKDDAKANRKRGAAKAAPKKDDDKKVEAKAEEPKVETTKEIKTPDGTKKVGGGDGNEPSFDALLKEAGVEDKKVEKPKLEKKSLSGDDFKKGMSAVQSKAQGCYKGTQGTASVKLTVGPDGKVTKASVGGQFAGKPEASCVEAAVKGATFPAWDGGPQSFNYSYMLAD